MNSGGRIMSIHNRRAGRAALERAIALGCWFSVGPAMLRRKRGSALAARMPRDRILIESDAPFTRLKGSPLVSWGVRAR